MLDSSELPQEDSAKQSQPAEVSQPTEATPQQPQEASQPNEETFEHPEDSSQAPIEIEPLTAQEQKDRGKSTMPAPEDDPEYPDEWKPRAKIIMDAVNSGFRYSRKTMTGKLYMVLRKGSKDKGLGLWNENKEAKLFSFYPQMRVTGAALEVKSGTPSVVVNPTGRTFASVPISRPAIIPREYIPTITVIRYYQMMTENGFPRDFSSFINEIVTWHFTECKGIELKVFVNNLEEE